MTRNRSASHVLQCPSCRAYTDVAWREGAQLLLACHLCGYRGPWRALFARRQALIIDRAAVAECRRDRR